MKSTHLITLSARIDELEQLRILNDLSFEEFTRLTLDANKQSKIIVKLGHFVASVNGVPLPRPSSNEITLQFIKEHKIKSVTEFREAYNEAQKDVIFEGWEVSKKIRQYIYLYNPICDIELEFDLIQGVIELNLNHSTLNDLYGDIKTLADLAAATTENPIKLK